MSQPSKGKKPPSSKPGGAPGKGSRAHGDKKSGASSKPGDKKGSEAAEKKPASTSASQPPKTKTSGAASTTKTQPPSAIETKAPDMKPTETKATSSHSQTSGLQSQSRKRNKVQTTQTAKTEPGKVAQSPKPVESQTKHHSKGKQKQPGGAKSPSKQTSPGKVATGQTDQSTQVSLVEDQKPKTENQSLASGAAVAAASTVGAVTAAGLVATADKPSAETKENKSTAPSSAVEAAPSKPREKSDKDKALDDLIDILGEPEELAPPSPVYTGPEITDSFSSTYIEELGKREGSIPPEYRKLLEGKGDDKAVPPVKTEEKSQKPMTDDDIADALSSDFTCSTSTPEEKKTILKAKPTEEGEIVQAQSTSSVRSSAPPKEKKPKLEEAAISDDALEALADTLGAPEPEPKEDLGSIVEVSEAKVKEKKIEKAGEHDDTIPPEYRLKPAMDKDGKPLLPKPEEKPKPISNSDLIDEFSKDFVCPAPPAAQSKPTDTSKKPAVAASGKAPAEEVVSSAAVSTVQSSAPSATTSVGQVSDEAVEALCGSLGKREPDPEEKKPAVDKVKEKAKQEEQEKLGEDEETIPPDYRLIAAKDKDGKPLLPKSEEKPQPMSESDLLDALSEGFDCSPATTLQSAPLLTPNKSTVVKSSPAASEVVSSTTASAVHSAAPPAATLGGKEQDNALDLLSDSLGQREPDPDENKPVVDKVKEGAKSEHRDKLGERDDTIPPDYRFLDSDQQGKAVKPKAKDDVKPKEPKKPTDDSAAIDALSGDFDKCAKTPATPQHPKDKSGKEAANMKVVTKDDGKPEDPKTAKEQSSSAKSETKKTS